MDTKKLSDVIKNGGVILYPTDTIPGIGCDATNALAIEKIYQIKQRPENKSLIILVSSDRMLQQYVTEVPEMAWDLIDFAEKPTTIIYPGARNLPKELIAEDGTIAIRMVRDGYLQKVIHNLGKPLVSTSANISGSTSPQNMQEIDESIRKQVDFIVDLPSESRSKASTIIKLALNGEFTIIRK